MGRRQKGHGLKLYGINDPYDVGNIKQVPHQAKKTTNNNYCQINIFLFFRLLNPHMTQAILNPQENYKQSLLSEYIHSYKVINFVDFNTKLTTLQFW